jgi:prepilin-type N-terminal cleavage/methylation domain-containing protein
MNLGFQCRMVKAASRAFTVVEMMVSMAVLALLMAMISQLLNSAASIATQGNKHMDGDAQARAVFDRMAIDFAQIVKRADVDYYLKDPVTTQAGNDQMAFYSQVPGYNALTPATSWEQSPVSLVAYRINSDINSQYYNQLERLGYGLTWNGYKTGVATDNGVMFSIASTTSAYNLISPNPQNTITANWQNATTTAKDASHEELIGPDVFRMEYYYILRGQTVSNGTTTSTFASQLSATPWDTGTPTPFTDHTSVNGLQDVLAITVVIAVIDPKSRALVSNTQLIALAGQMKDFDITMKPGALEHQWQGVIGSATGIPKIASSSIRVYRRDFYLPQINPIP